MADVNNPIRYSDLIVPDDAIEKLIQQLNELNEVYAKTLENIKKEATGLTAALRNVSGATEEGRATTRQAAEAAEQLAQKERKVKDAQKENLIEIQKLKAAQKEENQIAKLQAQIATSAEGSYNRLSAQYRLNKIGINKMTEAERKQAEQERKLISNTEKLYAQMKKLQAETGKHQLNVGNYPQLWQGVAGGLGLATTAMGATMLATGALSNAMKSGVGTAQDFQKSMSTLLAITGDTREGIAKLEEQARQLGATTIYTASEVVQLQTELAKLGYKNEDILNMTQSVLSFAQATGAGLAEAASLAGASLRMFGQDTTHTTEFVDKMAAATTNSALNFGFLENALSTVSPVANAFGFKIEEVLALLGQLANAGFDASTAATATRNILLNLANANGALAKSLGQPVTNLDELVKGLKGLEAAGIDLATSLDLTDKRSVAAFNTFIKQAEGAIQLRDTLNEANGAAQSMASTMADNLEGDTKALSSAWQELMLNINGGQSILRTAVQWLTDVIRSTGELYSKVRGYFKEMYDDSIAFRAVIQTIAGAFKTAGNTINLVFTSIGRQGKAVAQLLEGVFTLDWDKVKSAWKTQQSATIGALWEFADKQAQIFAESDNKILKHKKQTTKEIQKENAKQTGASVTGDVTAANIVNPTAEKEAKKAQAAAAKAEREREREERKREQAYKRNLEALRKYQDAELELEEDTFVKRRKKTEYQYQRQTEDLLHQLQVDKELTQEARDAITNTIATLEKRKAKEIEKIEQDRQLHEYELMKQGLELRLKSVREGSEEEYKLRMQLNEVEGEAELLANQRKEESQRQSTKSIIAANQRAAEKIADQYVQAQLEIFDKEQELYESEFDLLRKTEEQKTTFRLKAERDRLQKILELNKIAGTKLAATEVATIQNTIAKLDKEINTQERFGTSASTREQMKEGLEDAANYTLEILSTVTEARVKMAEEAVKAADKQVEAAQKTLETEREAAANGYANNQEMAQKELEAAKENQRKAIAQQKKTQKQQQVIDTLTQVSSLVTASANMWRDLGWPMALVGIATMWASFAASKIMGAKLAKSNTEEYGEGTVELLEGGSHASGHDIDLGVKKDGTRRRAEGGEFFAVINKRSSRRYRKQIPDIINSLNDGSFARKYVNAYDAANGNGVGMNVTMASPTDVSTLEGEVRKIREQGERRTYLDGTGTMVTTYKNVTRRVRR